MPATDARDTSTAPAAADRRPRTSIASISWWTGWLLLALLGALVFSLVGSDDRRGSTFASGDTCRMQLRNFGQAITLYRARHEGRLPASLDDLTPPDAITGDPYLQAVRGDPWGHPYAYRVLDAARGTYEVRSAGDDHVLDTPDDVVFPERTPGP